ncbi:MAG: recombination protein RecR [Candidatus Ryanbacteria bacterium RIFCSPHIGHO2_02_FULL_45_17b]|uniref:Recombination protein RecR n=1 Tax=Candidatus Ryanbacteria bacterium RIFCSPHIGHO2_01_FULL_45_22 TaxID=1802114 RepID=A0A1G2G0L0_9BACT|nr:MAG: recombination protein RecR [Candidatus Ryanbacteria bacterium RIFCSPHIGHO2_01_FULL_45_22]OGZ46988.1 MAG: recombination protein RecR [Candidatus Ryanbacteria bacterium RIFCSPHIGHO2_02_FULL_45_17b]
MAHPKHIQRTTELLGQLPGIGPRQALRLSYVLAEKNIIWRKELAQLLESFDAQLSRCELCFRVMEQRGSSYCDICSSPSRAKDSILVVEKESDVEQFETYQQFQGTYHVTGGTISPLEKNPGEKLRLRALFERVKTYPARSTMEVIIATSNTLEGNQTAAYIERILQPLQIKITRLGRGLSTGAEIEYADPLTLEQALKNRK